MKKILGLILVVVLLWRRVVFVRARQRRRLAHRRAQQKSHSLSVIPS